MAIRETVPPTQIAEGGVIAGGSAFERTTSSLEFPHGGLIWLKKDMKLRHYPTMDT